MSGCELCPRRCRVDRFGENPKAGWCGASNGPRVCRWGPHFGEEPPLCGERGSGCVFFSRCTMKCLYCQNSPWSWGGEGRARIVVAATLHAATNNPSVITHTYNYDVKPVIEM